MTNTLASYERKRLIGQKVPFIVPGNQLYLPDLGIDLREYFRRRPSSTESPLSPSAQAMLIAALLRPRWETEWHPAEAMTMLRYTPMTLSRAVRELTSAAIASAHKAGRSQYLQFELSPPQIWERAKPVLRSPVKRTLWTLSTPAAPEFPKRLAGLSALAHQSMLTEPPQPVYAVSNSTWKAVHASIEELPEPLPGAHEWQLWSYNPALQPDSETVDPLSLMLSLQDSPDERVQIALDELKGQLLSSIPCAAMRAGPYQPVA